MDKGISVVNSAGVNCYLLRAGDNSVLIDTGISTSRRSLERRLTDLGALPDSMKLIILTHGDSDHAGNAAYFQNKYGAKIAIHAADQPMVERGDMNCGRKPKSDKISPVFRLVKALSPLFSRAAKFEVFKPDILIDEKFDFKNYDLNAEIVHLPGHSKGSIGVLTADGSLYCGDFIYNMLGFDFVDNLADHRASVEKVKTLDVKIIYPGHGKPISMERFLRKYC